MERITVDQVLVNISAHLHLSKETENEILAEIRTHLEDAVAAAISKGEDEQTALKKAADQGVFLVSDSNLCCFPKHQTMVNAHSGGWLADTIVNTKKTTRINIQDFSIIERIFRNRNEFFIEIREGIDLQPKMRAMLFSSICFFALYGAVMGSSHSLWQALSSAIKLPVLFLATLFVCVPSLYFFSLLFGSNQSLSQNLSVILTAICVTGVLLLSCAPIILFFLLTTSQYQFFKLLNVAIFAVSGFMGVGFSIRE